MERFGTQQHHALVEAGLDAVYIVHYSKFKTRRKQMEGQLKREGMQADFITGWDREVAKDEDVMCMWPSSKLFEAVAKQRHFAASWLEVRELTLAMKHASAWYAAVANGYRHILVLEDDARWDQSLVQSVSSILTNQTIRNDYDIIFLGSYNEDEDWQGQQGVQRDGPNRGGVAYLLSQAGAKHLISQPVILTGTADHMLSNGGASKGGGYPNPPPRRWSHRPWLVWQHSREFFLFGLLDHLAPKDYCWTHDMGPCTGELCPLHPAFISKHIIRPRLRRTAAAVRFVNGTVLDAPDLFVQNETASSKREARKPRLRRSSLERHGGPARSLAHGKSVD